jgi:3-oxoacid CoA-transferase B subunit
MGKTVDKPKLDRQTIALRVAKEFRDGMVVNLGFGIPSLAASYVPPEKEVLFHTENGALGFGPFATSPDEEDFDLINASGQFVTPQPGMSFFDHAESFTMIRGGHIDICVLGGLQVSEKGDLASWLMPGRKMGNIGGGMDLASGSKKVIVAMTHTMPNGVPKIVKNCSYALTAPNCVGLIVTDIAVIQVTEQGLLLCEVAPGWTANEVQELTEPRLLISPDLKEIELL